MALQMATRQMIIKMIDELPNEVLPDVMKFLEFLRFKTGRNGDGASRVTEAALLETIHRRLPADDQRRLSSLRQKSEVGQLTEAEHAELLAYAERVELEDATRAEAIVQLAQLRDVPLARLMRDLELEPAADAA